MKQIIYTTDKKVDFRETIIMDSRGPKFKAQPTDMKDLKENGDDKLFNRLVNKVKAASDHPVLIVSADVSHTGYVNENFRYYHPGFGKVSAKSWNMPYPKPVLLEHRKHDGFGESASEPLGRAIKGIYVDFGVTGGKANDLVTRKGVQRVYSTISGSENIEKVMDGRYLTISVSGNSETVKCSICGTDLKKAGCEHDVGETYDKKLAYMIYDRLYFDEWSYVLLPADTQAKNNRFELVSPEDSISVYNQITNDVGVVKNRGKNNDGNISIYYAADSGGVFDLLPSNIDSNKIDFILDGEDLFACYKDACQLVDSVQDESVDDTNESNNVNDVPNTTQEENSMEGKDIKNFTDLLKIPLVKTAYDAQLVADNKDILSKLADAEKEVATLTDSVTAKDKVIEAKDKEIEGLNKTITTHNESERDELIDTVIDLQRKVKHTAIIKIDEMEDKTKEEALTTYKEELGKRTLESIKDTIEDLTAIVPAEDNNSDTNNITDSDDGAPDTKVNGQVINNPKTTASDGKTDPIGNIFKNN